jgi:hypothetical protein
MTAKPKTPRRARLSDTARITELENLMAAVIDSLEELETPDKGPPMYKESRVDTLYIHDRLWDALDSDDIAREISDLFNEMAYNFKIDTGLRPGDVEGRS